MLYGDPAACLSAPAGARDEPEIASWKALLSGMISRGRAGDRTWRTPALFSIIAILVLASGYGGYAIFNSDASKDNAIPNAQLAAPLTLSPPAAPSPTVAAPLTLAMNIIGQRKEPDGRYAEVIIREGSVLRSRDHFQVHLEINRRAHIYVLLFDSQGQASQLFPDPKIEQQGLIEAGQRVTVPDRDLWFWLDDHPGTETIYVLASEEPLADIHLLLQRMQQANETERKQLSGEIKERIKIVERGVGGVAKGKTVNYPLSGGRRVEKVTEVVVGTGAVVRAISFEHK
jgi:hypothetical protein